MYNAEMIKKEAFTEGYKQGLARGIKDNVNNEKHYAEGFKAGREAGFAAGYAAAQGQPAAKIEAAYEQGRADAAKLVPVRHRVSPQEDEEMNDMLTGRSVLLRKNGVGY